MSSVTLGDLLTSVSILVVLATFVIGYLERRSSNRRRRTLDFLLAIMEEQGPMREANLQFANWISKGRVIEDDQIDADDDRIIVTLIDFYDLISDSAMRGIVDEEMVILHLGGRMRSAYEFALRYIGARRDSLGRPALYQSFEKFVVEHIKDRNV